ncbi:MAG TPA: cytochrome c [Anaeromyxobacteraceae bacterium]|nr:cytochrome c [Anaeromyxobacteraceae bacterium]
MSFRPAALAAAALLCAGCDVLDPMMEQDKVRTYRPSDFYDDGIAMRGPPAGTVAVGSALPPEVRTGLAPDGKPLQRIPVPLTPELLQTGRKRFDIICATCHGLVGDGKSLVARNMSLRPPPSLHDYAARPDGYLYQVVSQGFGLMPAYSAELTVEERWAVVAYLRALQLSQRSRLEEAPPEVRARLEREAR